MVKKLQFKMVLLLGLLLAGVSSVWATDAVWPGTTALPGSYANVGGDGNVQIMISSTNTFTNPIRVYANTTISIKVADGYTIESVTYEASSTGNYVTYAQNATVNPTVAPTVSDKNVTWSFTDEVKVFTITPSSQTRANSITITYATTGSIPTHTATFSVNGTTSTQDFAEGAAITFPNDPADIYGKTFVGWATTTIDGTTNVAPDFVTSATMGNADVTYYAVFANKSVTSTEITKTYGFETESDDDWDISGPTRTEGNANNGNYSGHINTNNTYVTFNHKVKVKEFSFAFKRTSNNNNYNVYIETSVDKTNWNASVTYAMSSFENGTYSTKTHSFDGNNELYVRFHCYNTTAVRYVDDITIKYIEVTTTYSEYCTSVATTATITLNSACTDGEYVYGTYSNSSAFVVSDDIIVAEVGIENGALNVVNYETGATVPANTGVMVSALEGGDYTVELSSEAGSSVLGDDNMLKATGDAGITAADMAAENTKFYRLTMHNGTEIGFWWGAEGGAAFALGANKAYLAVVPGSAGVRAGYAFFADDDAAGIAEIKSMSNGDNEKVYNLNGQRVSKATKGLYIVNGKKMLMK